ncbi:MAG: thioredoxin-like domain-containing protein [Bacteroidota bacterium]|jgi:thiol-disulfide isomerase/thioredoxin
MKKKTRILWIFILVFRFFDSQTITATFTGLAGQEIKFGTFYGLQSKATDSTIADKEGKFSFPFNSDKPSIGYLMSSENKPFFLILDKNEKIELRGINFLSTESIQTVSGNQNIAFAKYGAEHPRREQALSAWRYLQKIYLFDSLFSNQNTPKKAIESEMLRVKNEDKNFLKSLDQKTYVSWYLPVRRLVSDVSIIAQYRVEEIPATMSAFRKLDYTDHRLYRSGLLRDAIDSHFWLLENSGRSLDSVFIEMKISIDSMLLFLGKDEKKLNEVTDYLFDLLERHSLFRASEYLALKVLNEVSCTLNNDLSKQLETYRKMKKGNIAPDIDFTRTNVLIGQQNEKSPKKLSDLKSNYFVIVFGAGWCPKCKEEVPEIASLYNNWKKYGVEVVFVSLDDKETDFKSFAANFPFISICDYKKWSGSVVQDYYVFGTPTIFLLNDKREILLRPNSVKQMDAWVDWFLVKGNK